MHHRIRGALAALTVVILIGLTLGGARPAVAMDEPARAASATDSGRPVVILVHGRGQLPGDSAAVRVEWSRVLRTGASTMAGVPVLRDDDVWLAWYADALDPLAPPVCASHRQAEADPAAPEQGGEGLRPVFAAMGEGLVALLDVFDGYARAEARALAGDLLFLGDPLRRCAGESRLEDALARADREGRPVILVAHSFGSLLSYGYLRSLSSGDASRFEIRRFITIGSLLGAPGARELLLGDTATTAVVPPAVRAWTNIVDVRDALAYSIAFGSDADSARVQNLTTTSGGAGADAHDVLRYLRDPVTVRSVAGAWCRAFDAGVRERAPQGCSIIGRPVASPPG